MSYEQKLVYAYESQPVSEDTASKIRELRSAYSTLHKIIENVYGLPMNPRYSALAKTALEESAMWAVKSLTHM